MPQTVELVGSFDEAQQIKRDVEQRSLRAFNKDEPFLNSQVSIVRAMPNLHTGQVSTVIYRHAIRPEDRIVAENEIITLNAKETESLNRHLARQKVEDMASPFVGGSIPENEQRPKSDLFFENDHYVFDMSTFDPRMTNRPLEVEAMAFDLQRSTNVPLAEMGRGVQGGITDLTHSKLDVIDESATMREVAGRVLMDLGLSRNHLSFDGLSPWKIHDMVEEEVQAYGLRKKSIPTDALKHMGILYNLAKSLTEKSDHIDAFGEHVYSESLRTSGYGFPSLIESVDQLVDKSDSGFGIGSREFLFDL